MQYDFDQIIDRRGTNSVKWEHFPADVLPLWVADTDFAVEPAIIRRIQKIGTSDFRLQYRQCRTQRNRSTADGKTIQLENRY